MTKKPNTMIMSKEAIRNFHGIENIPPGHSLAWSKKNDRLDVKIRWFLSLIPGLGWLYPGIYVEDGGPRPVYKEEDHGTI